MTPVSQSDDHPDDPLVESLLEELMGGAAPPDLSAQILARLSERRGKASGARSGTDCTESEQIEEERLRKAASGMSVAAESLTDERHPALRSIAVSTRDEVRLRATRQRKGQRLVWWLAAGSVCASLAWVGYHLRPLQNGPGNATIATDSPASNKPSDPSREGAAGSSGGNSSPQLRDARPHVSDSHDLAKDDSAPTPEPNLDRSLAADDNGLPVEPVDRSALDSELARAPAADETIVQRINEQLAQRWQLAQLAPAAPVRDEVWCQRVYQRLVGRDPLPGERREFLRDESPTKREDLIARILSEPKLRGEYAAHWSKIWTDWLIGRSPKTLQVGLQQHLQEAILNGQPYDQMLTSLVTAAGSNIQGDADFNGATNYLLALSDEGEPEIVAELCRIALGKRTDCARCHDSTLSDLKQDQFWQMAAVFEGLKIDTLRPGRHRLAYDSSQATQVTFAFPEAPRKAYEPAYLDGSTLKDQEAGRSDDLRQALADRLVNSPEMPQAVVNRLWAELFEYGFTYPVDDMGSHNPSEHGELLEQLAGQFVAHDYQLDSLLRWMLLADPLTRSSTITVGNQSDFPDAGGPALFSWFYEQTPHLFVAADQGLRRLAAGNAPNVTSSTLENTSKLLNARRAQDLQNHESSGELAASDGPSGRLVPVGYLRLVRSLNSQSLSPEAKLDHIFRMVLHREPTKEERQQAGKIFEAAGGDSVVAMERIFWALINSK